MILEEKSERRDQSSFSFLKNINFRKSLPQAPKFEYPPLGTTPALSATLPTFKLRSISRLLSIRIDKSAALMVKQTTLSIEFDTC